MGVLPLQFLPEEDPESLGLTGEETFEISGIADLLNREFKGGGKVSASALHADGKKVDFTALVRIDTPQEALYYRHGGILQYVLRQLLNKR
jgi:aconitate hydratase